MYICSIFTQCQSVFTHHLESYSKPRIVQGLFFIRMLMCTNLRLTTLNSLLLTTQGTCCRLMAWASLECTFPSSFLRQAVQYETSPTGLQFSFYGAVVRCRTPTLSRVSAFKAECDQPVTTTAYYNGSGNQTRTNNQGVKVPCDTVSPFPNISGG